MFFLAGLYTHRVLAGGEAADVEVSKWLLAFCIFFFLSLAFAKRYAELLRVQDEDQGSRFAAGLIALKISRSSPAVGPASGYLSVLVLALYVNQSDLVGNALPLAVGAVAAVPRDAVLDHARVVPRPPAKADGRPDPVRDPRQVSL